MPVETQLLLGNHGLGLQLGRRHPEVANDTEGPNGLEGDLAPNDGNIAVGRGRNRRNCLRLGAEGLVKQRASAPPAGAHPASAAGREAQLPRPTPCPHAAPAVVPCEAGAPRSAAATLPRAITGPIAAASLA